jgi:tetratricopeptide (TPR) repeat protein
VPQLRHLTAAAVAASVVGLALANGGYYPRATAIATLVVWWIVLVALVFGLLPRARLAPAGLAVAAMFGGLALWTAISLGWASDDGRAFIEVVRAAGYAGLLVLALIAPARGQARQWLGGLAIGATIVVAIALLSRCEPGLFDTGRGEIATSLASARGRLGFPVGYWNALGGVAALSFVLLAWAAVSAGPRPLRALSAGALPLAVLAIFLSSSRGGAISAIVGVVFLFTLARNRERLILPLGLGLAAGAALSALADSRHAFSDDLGNGAAASQGDTILMFSLLAVLAVGLVVYACDGPVRRAKLPSLPIPALAAALAVVAVVAAVAVDLPQKLDEFNDAPSAESLADSGGTAHLASGSGNGRWQFWEAAGDAFDSEPVRGIGAGGYEDYWNQHGSLAVPVRNAHSLPLETLAELGLVGGVLLIGGILVAFAEGLRRAVRQRGDAVAAVAVLSAALSQSLIDWTWELPAAFGFAVVAAGLLVGPGTDDVAEPEGTRPARRFGWGVAALVAAFASIWVAGVLLLSDTQLEQSRAAVRAGDLEQAASDARDASALQPWAAEPKLQLALVAERAGALGEARSTLADAIGKAPEDWTLWAVAARIDLARGRIPQAREDLDKAQALNPRATVLNPPIQ